MPLSYDMKDAINFASGVPVYNPSALPITSNVSGASSGLSGLSAGLGITNAALGIGSWIYNIVNQQKQQKLAQQNWQTTFDYQKQLNQLVMDREDTAYQRAVEDARKAGLSPLAAISGGASPATALNTASAYSPNSGSVDASGSGNIGTLLGLANQIDMQKNQLALEWFKALTEQHKMQLSYNESVRHNKASESTQSTIANAASSQAETAAKLAGIQSGIFDINRYYAENTGLPYGFAGVDSKGGSVSAGPFSGSYSSSTPLTVKGNDAAPVKFIEGYNGSYWNLHDYAKSNLSDNNAEYVIDEIWRRAEQMYKHYVDKFGHNNPHIVSKDEFLRALYERQEIPYFISPQGGTVINKSEIYRLKEHSR